MALRLPSLGRGLFTRFSSLSSSALVTVSTLGFRKALPFLNTKSKRRGLYTGCGVPKISARTQRVRSAGIAGNSRQWVVSQRIGQFELLTDSRKFAGDG